MEGGSALEIETFLGTVKWHRTDRGPKEVALSSKWHSPIKSIYVRGSINHRCIKSYYWSVSVLPICYHDKNELIRISNDKMARSHSKFSWNVYEILKLWMSFNPNNRIKIPLDLEYRFLKSRHIKLMRSKDQIFITRMYSIIYMVRLYIHWLVTSAPSSATVSSQQ